MSLKPDFESAYLQVGVIVKGLLSVPLRGIDSSIQLRTPVIKVLVQNKKAWRAQQGSFTDSVAKSE